MRAIACFRHVLAAILSAIFAAALSPVMAQTATLNPGTYATNTPLNSGATGSGTLSNLGTGTGPGGWKSARFDFGYSVSGTAQWNGGIQFQSQSGVEQLWNQPDITNFPTATGNYNMTWSRKVAGLTFYQGGLDVRDRVRIQAFNGGVPVNLPTSYISGLTGSVSIIANTATSIDLIGTGGGNADERANEYKVTFPSNVLVDEIRYIVAKDGGSTGTVTLAFYLFDWLPLTIDAIDDAYGPINGAVGGVTSSVRLNDKLNGDSTTGTNVTVTPGVAPSPASGSITMTTFGRITVAPGTTAGVYSYPYTLCEVANPTNCDTAIATVTVSAPVIDAVDDAPAAVNGATGATTPTVLGNDTLNGAPVNPAAITLTPGTAPTPAAGSITMNANGTITVAAGTTAGSYSYSYSICQNINPTNCDTATATVTVSAPVIDAVDDAPAAVNGVTGATTPTVLGNDTLNGAAVNPAAITLTPGTAPTPAAGLITMNPDGTITVAAGTTAGSYSYPYTICEITNPTNCDTATATVTVSAPVIDAVDDAPASIGGAAGGNLPSVLTNDSYNGSFPASLTNVTLTPGAAPTPAAGAITMNPDGTITVVPGTTAGTYSYPYTICDTLNPTNCDTATATVLVDAASIDAADDTPPPVNGLAGATTASVLANDSFNGVIPATLANVALTPGTAPTPAAGAITMNPDGTITVAPGTTAGSYSYPYTICEVLNPTNCDSAIATVTVGAPVIDAVDDTPVAITGSTGGSTPTVLGNDTLNGLAVNPAAITLTPGTAPSPVAGSIAMNPDGTITVASGTTAGIYFYDYTICQNANPTNCDTATATVTVATAPIDAIDDSPASLVGAAGGTTPTVLGNDTLNGAIVNPADITLTPGTAPSPTVGLITMNPDGTITVAPGTTAGTYSYTYTICEILNPTNCDTATATVVVTPAVIDAVDDTPTAVSGIAGATLPTVLGNDTLNGGAVNPAAITLTPGTAPAPASGSITMNPDGTITVAAGTTAGTYSYPYSICEIANPTNCDTATATVIVNAGTIDAVDDAPAPVDGDIGGTSPTVLGNDTLNGSAVNPADITLTPGTAPAPAAGSITMNPDGTITIAVGTTPGTYSYPYTICAVLNPTNCDSAVATVIVNAPLDAVDDAPPPVSGGTGGTTPSVLGNDTLNGATVNPAAITLTPGTAPAPAAGSITMNPDGTITIAAGTTPGSYNYPYTICDVAIPTRCDTAVATIVVSGPVVAVDDAPPPIGSATGGTTPSVLGNDRLNGTPVSPATVTLTPGTAPAPAAGSITMNPDGTITVAAGTTPGTYVYPYTICDITDPTVCDTAVATVVVAPGAAATVLEPDVSRGNLPGTPVTIRVIANDLDPLNVLDPTTLQIVGTAIPGDPLVVPGQGIWTVDLAAGTITFTPEPGFTGNPTPIQYQLRDTAGTLIAPTSVIITYEGIPAFICSDIIGKVFDDANADGQQDAGEKGMPGVRLATVNGQIITTDNYGRYHVPCAAIPKDIGSNFLIKLDTASLPTGYRVTTENPRVVRLSQGMMSRMNFGVSISNVVKIDLAAAAFATKDGSPVAALNEGIADLVDQIARTPSVVRLDYHRAGEDKDLAKTRLDAVEEMLRDRWTVRGKYKLIVEKTIVSKR